VAGVSTALPAGVETSIFMVPNGTAVAGLRAGLTNQLTAGGWAKFSPTSAYPTIADPNVVLDGATQTANVGDTNSGYVGTGGTVGVSGTTLAQFDKPEVEIYLGNLSAGATNYLSLTATSDAIRSVAISAGYLSVSGASSQITDVLIGMDGSGTSSATTTENTNYGIWVGTGSGITLHHNYIRVNNTGIRRDNAGGSNLTIEYNEINTPTTGMSSTLDGVILWPGGNDVVQYNLIKNMVGAALEMYAGGASGDVFQENTLTGNGMNNGGAGASGESGAVVICGGNGLLAPQMTFSRNIVTASGGAAFYVMAGVGWKFTQNSTYSNGGLGIDLDPSGTGNCNSYTPNGVTSNATFASYPNTGYPNSGMNFPTITAAGATGAYAAVSGYVGNGSAQAKFVNATVEVFKSDGDASGYGEGQTYLGSLTVDANGNFSGTVGGVSGVTISIGDKLTATATDTSGNTSEFGPNFTVSGSYPTEKFNAFESSTAAGAITGVIQTKISGSTFGLDLVALNSAGTAVYTTFVGTVSVQLLDASNNSGALGSNGCRSTWSAIGSSTNVTFASVNNGRVSTTFSMADAYRDVRVQLTYVPPVGSTVVACSSDDFAIRPNKLALLAASDADWATAGTGRTLSNTGASGGTVHKAGRPFTLTAQAQNSAGTLTSLYTGSPSATLSCLLPSGCGAPDLGSLTFTSAFASGALNATDASYTEAGAFSLTLTDTTFAAVDAADSTTAQRYIVSDTINVGRFVPDHFALATTTAGTLYTYGSSTCATRSFTYLGVPVAYKTPPTVTVTAQNAANGTTRNYKGALWKLTSASVAQTYSDAGGATISASSGGATVTSNGNGTGTVSPNAADTITWVRSTSTPTAPITAQPVDTIGVTDTSESSGTIASAPATLGVTLGFDQTAATAAGAQMLYGRLYVGNAFGIETLNLTLPVETQYWTGSVWVTSAGDYCTTLSAAAFAQSNWKLNLAGGTCLTSTATGGGAAASRGKFTVWQTAPGSGHAGSVDLTVDLGSATIGNACVGGSATSAALSLAYLQGNWGGAGYTANPTGRASFGNYAVAPGFRREQ
jgi:Right handed beta helix region